MKQELSKEQEILEAVNDVGKYLIAMNRIDVKIAEHTLEKKALQKQLSMAQDRLRTLN